MTIEERLELFLEKNCPTDPAKWSASKSAAKAKFDVYPCVPLNSLGVTPDGFKSYDELEIGDDILTYNLNTQELEWKPILNLHYYENADLMEIKKPTGFHFKCTPNHKWVIKREFDRAPELIEAKDITTHMRMVFAAKFNKTNSDINLLKENWGKHDTWVNRISKMSASEREVWLSSAIVYDGWEKGKSAKVVDRRTFGFSQKNRDHLLATVYAAYLNGYYVSINDLEKDVVGVTIIRGKDTHGTQNVKKVYLDEKEDVWCPETENQTWVMVQNGWLTITGNSAYANGWAAKNYKSKGGGWRTCKESYDPAAGGWVQPSGRIPVENPLDKDEDELLEGPCWDGYKQVGMKNKNGKEVPNCVPISELNESIIATLMALPATMALISLIKGAKVAQIALTVWEKIEDAVIGSRIAKIDWDRNKFHKIWISELFYVPEFKNLVLSKLKNDPKINQMQKSIDDLTAYYESLPKTGKGSRKEPKITKEKLKKLLEDKFEYDRQFITEILTDKIAQDILTNVFMEMYDVRVINPKAPLYKHPYVHSGSRGNKDKTVTIRVWKNLVTKRGIEELLKIFNESNVNAAIENLEKSISKSDKNFNETIKKVGDKYAVYPKKGGDRLGTHSSKSAAQKQLAAIEISKQKAIKENKIHEASFAEVIATGLVAAVAYTAYYAIDFISAKINSYKDYKKYLKEPHMVWFSLLENNPQYKKYVYHTLKNDKKIIQFQKSLSNDKNSMKKPTIDWDKWKYENDLVKRLLSGPIAQNALKETYEKLEVEEDYDKWKNKVMRDGINEFAKILNSGQTKKELNKWAKKEGLETINENNMKEEYPDHPERRDKDSEINYGRIQPVEYDVENYDDYKDFIVFMREYTTQLNEAGCGCVFEAEYQGRKVKLGKPMQGDTKKFKVYVKNDKGNVVKVNFGDPNMRIKKSNPERRKSFRARHNCDNPGPRYKARYWSCRAW